MNSQIEVTSHCSIECKECPNHMMRRKRQHMTPEVFDTILTKYVIPYRDHGGVRECPPTVIPHKDGESLLNRHFPSYLQRISDAAPEFKIDIYSHGLLLPKKTDFVPFLGSLRNKVRLMVSFHFVNHDGTRNDYGPLTEYMKDLLSNSMMPGNSRLPSNVELIFVSHLIAPTTQSELDEWKSNWEPFVRTGVLSAVHTNASINPWTGLMADVATCKYDGCPYANFGHMFFGAGGEVTACCMDLEQEITFGNVMHDDPADMVAKLEEFYAAQRRRDVKHPVCFDCFQMPPRTDLIQVGSKV